MYFYISSVQPLTIDNSIYVDLIGYPNGSGKHIVRISNIQVSLTIMYPPPLVSIENFDAMVQRAVDYSSRKTNDVTLKHVFLKDAHFYYFDHKFDYLEIVSGNIYVLKRFYQNLSESLADYYKRRGCDFNSKEHFIINNEEEEYGNNYSYHENQIFFRNIESPWRFTENSLSITSVKYYLSCKYNIPQIGWVNIDDRWIVKEGVPEDFIKKCPLIKVNGTAITGINQTVITPLRDVKPPPIPLIMVSYDIETVKDGHDGIPLWNNGGYIITISAGVFKIDDPKPYRRVCFISKPVEPPEDYTYDPAKKRLTTADGTEIYICSDEKEIIHKFSSFLYCISPDFICTFNGYGYDDPFVYYRSGGSDHGNIYSPYELKFTLLQAYTVYDIGRLTRYHKYLIPQFKKIELKIDGERDMSNQSIISQNCLSIDVYKILKKLDTKRFSTPGSGTLNKMLETYNIRDPFNDQLVAQKSGLSIEEMNKCWESNDPKRVYHVAKYCTQDAYITGTLLIEKSIILDYIEKAVASCTSVYNSFLHADGIRVNKVITSYAHRFGFAYMDTPPTARAGHSNSEYETYTNEQDSTPIEEGTSRSSVKIVHETLGMKVHNHDKIIGGAVQSYAPGKHKYVMALDFSSMYPSQKEGSNIDSSTRLDGYIIGNPSKFNIEITSIDKTDFYSVDGKRRLYYITRNKQLYLVEQFFMEFSSGEGSSYQQSLYFVQNTPDIFDTFEKMVTRKALKGIMLFDLRQLRNEAKKQLKMLKDKLTLMNPSQAEYLDVKREINRYKAKELSYKVLCNSEYGASDSKFFSHYDPDIAASVTCSSRRLISFLRYILEFGKYLITDVDLKSLQENLSKFNYDLFEYTPENVKSVFNKDEQLSHKYTPETWSSTLKKQYILRLPRSRVIYQDTDSNYYVNPEIQQSVNSTDIRKKSSDIMVKMYAYNEVVSYLCKSIINRNPINAGFEGAFLVSRYFSVKKRYYGFKWVPKMEVNLHSGKYLIQIDKQRVDNMALTDYLDEIGVKVTGVDLTRRDVYRYINLFHLQVLREDLSFCDTDLSRIILDMLIDFRDNIYSCDSRYNIEDFSMVDKLKLSSSRYRSTAKTSCDYVRNKAYMIKEKLETELKYCTDDGERARIQSMIPEVNQQIKYFIAGKEYSRLFKVLNNAELIDEQKDKSIGSYIDQINVPYYLDKLCSALGNYLDDSPFFKDFNTSDKISEFLFAIFYTTRSKCPSKLVNISTEKYHKAAMSEPGLVERKQELVTSYNIINAVYLFMVRNRIIRFDQNNIDKMLNLCNIKADPSVGVTKPLVIQLQNTLFDEYFNNIRKALTDNTAGDLSLPYYTLQTTYENMVEKIVSLIEKILILERTS